MQSAITTGTLSMLSLLTELSAAGDSERVYGASLQAAVACMELFQPAPPGLVGAIWRFSPHPETGTGIQGRLAAAHGLPDLEQELVLTGNGGLIRRVLQEGHDSGKAETGGLHKTAGVQEDTQLSQLTGLQDCRAACAVRLEANGEQGAVLLLAHPEEDFFGEARGEALSLVARQAATAIRQANLLKEAMAEKERIREVEAEARRQMARDLHDGPTQSIAALAMRVNFARRMLDRDARAAAEELAKVEELARDITKAMRHLLFVLRPLVLESHGLAAALDALADKYHEAYQFSLENSVDLGLLPNLSIYRQAALFYFIEEALNQARKKAGASQAWVHIGKRRPGGTGEVEGFILEIEDDGAPPSGDWSERISGMLRERAALIGASLNLEAREGGGARLSLAAPLADSKGSPPA